MKMHIIIIIGLALLLTLVVGAVQAQPRVLEGVEFLELVAKAPTIYSYQGEMISVTWNGDQATSQKVRYYHAVPDDNRWEFLDEKDRVELVVIDDSQRRWEVSPDQSSVRITDSLQCCDLAQVQSELVRLYQNYEVFIVGSGLVAGQEAILLNLVPRYSGNPRLVLWIDAETGVVLRWEKYNSAGDMTQMGMFTKYEVVGELDEGLFKYKPSTAEKVIIEDSPAIPEEVVYIQKQLGEVVRYPTGLPPGYHFSQGRVLSRYRPADTVQLQFTDGLNCISVFETFHPVPHFFTGETGLAATKILMDDTQVYLVQTVEGFVLNWSKGHVTYSIVGDVPVEQIRQIAHSLRE